MESRFLILILLLLLHHLSVVLSHLILFQLLILLLQTIHHNMVMMLWLCFMFTGLDINLIRNKSFVHFQCQSVLLILFSTLNTQIFLLHQLFPTTLFLVRHLSQLKIHIYERFLIINQTPKQFVYLNHIELCFTRFCYRLF